MARKFIEHGHTKANDNIYQKLDTEITQMALAAAKKVARRNFGYTRNDETTHRGRMVILYKMICECKVRRAPWTSALVRRALALEVPLAQFESMTCKEIRVEVQERQGGVLEAPKRCEAGRIEWLETEVRKRAKAAGDKNWEKNLNEMIRATEERGINRKLTALTKGINEGALGQIKVVTHDWFYSIQQRELYHYEAGNFEVFRQKEDNKFYLHHFLKVLPHDALQVLVGKDNDGY